MAMICRRAVVTGRVQGVFFRASTRDEALKNDVSGYAKNLRDGSVEVLMSGESANVNALEKWLSSGPPTAIVENVVIETCEQPSISGFKVL